MRVERVPSRRSRCGRLSSAVSRSWLCSFPNVGSAQGSPHRTAPPVVNAATADWQLNSEPIIVSSTLFQATRATRMFDGQVMVQVGVYQRVPVYADITLEPYSVVYVPVARNQLRVYERRRDHDLAATTGSRRRRSRREFGERAGSGAGSGHHRHDRAGGRRERRMPCRMRRAR